MNLTKEQVERLRKGENFNEVVPYTGWAKDESEYLQNYVSYFRNGKRVFNVDSGSFDNLEGYSNEPFVDSDQPISLQEASELVAKNLGLEFCRAKENGDVEGVYGKYLIRKGKLLKHTVEFTLSEAIEELKKIHPSKRIIITI